MLEIIMRLFFKKKNSALTFRAKNRERTNDAIIIEYKKTELSKYFEDVKGLNKTHCYYATSLPARKLFEKSAYSYQSRGNERKDALDYDGFRTHR